MIRDRPWMARVWLWLFLLVVVTCAPGTTRWSIGIDFQRRPSNPFRLYLHDRGGVTVHRGVYATFRVAGFERLRLRESMLVKRIVAIEGDAIGISGNWLLINGQKAARINPVVLARAGLAQSRLVDEDVVPEGKVLLLGASADSFDGRYFGFVDVVQLEGRAIPLW